MQCNAMHNHTSHYNTSHSLMSLAMSLERLTPCIMLAIIRAAPTSSGRVIARAESFFAQNMPTANSEGLGRDRQKHVRRVLDRRTLPSRHRAASAQGCSVCSQDVFEKTKIRARLERSQRACRRLSCRRCTMGCRGTFRRATRA